MGTDALAEEISSVGLHPVRNSAETPVVVVQGHSPTTGWHDIAEATLAIRSGALWVATNLDVTFPTERGLVPGNPLPHRPAGSSPRTRWLGQRWRPQCFRLDETPPERRPSSIPRPTT